MAAAATENWQHRELEPEALQLSRDSAPDPWGPQGIFLSLLTKKVDSVSNAALAHIQAGSISIKLQSLNFGVFEMHWFQLRYAKKGFQAAFLGGNWGVPLQWKEIELSFPGNHENGEKYTLLWKKQGR